MSISLDLSNVELEKNYPIKESEAIDALKKLIDKSGDGKDCLGWLDLPANYDKEELKEILKHSVKVQNHSKVLVVIGVGGSYLGTRAIEESLKPYFSEVGEVELIYVGHQLSSSYIVDLLKYLEGKDYSINVISKSGSTIETAIAFRMLKENIEEKYGKENAKSRIFVTTDASKGKLNKIAKEEDYKIFAIPNNVGGRFSVFTAVGIFPLAVAGINVEKLLEGAKEGYEKNTILKIEENMSLKYAMMRNILYNEGKIIEILGIYEEKLKYLAEWWKQLSSESEGKNGKGIFPSSVTYTTDLHSMGQVIQDGMRNIFETIISVKKPQKDILIKKSVENNNCLSYLENNSVDYVNKKVMEGTVAAHREGGVSNIIIEMDELDEKNIGELLYFFQMSIAISGYIMGINPFNQPGVEKYKEKVFDLFKVT